MVPVGKVTYNNGGLAVGSLWPASKIHLQNPILFLEADDHLIFIPIGSMYGIFTYIHHKNQPNVGKYIIHGSYGIFIFLFLFDWKPNMYLNEWLEISASILLTN